MKRLCILATMLAIGFTSTCVWASGDALEVAYKQGDISKNTYVMERLKSVMAPDEMNPLFRQAKSDGTPEPVKGFTMLLRYAMINIDSFSPEEQAYIRMFQKRPDDATNTDDSFGGGWHLPADKTSTTTDNGKYRIHYTTTATADSGGHVHQTQESFITNLKEVIDDVYAQEITAMGYDLPPDDGNGEFDIFIMDCGASGIYGYVAIDDIESPVGDGNEYTSYMVIDNDFLEFENTPLDSMKVTFAHEFHHAVQNGINGLASPWYYETTATWIEEQVYDDINDNRQYLSDFFGNPERSLDTKEQGQTFEYGTWVFNEYLSSKWGTGIIKEIWTALDPDDNYVPMDGVISVVTGKGSTFKDVFTDFAAENYSKKIYSEAGDATDKYVDVKFLDSITLSNKESTSEASTTIDHLASKYIKISPSSAESATLTLSINGADGKELSAMAVVKNGATYTKHLVTLDASTVVGSVAIDNFSTASVTEVVLVLVNYSKAQDSSEVAFSAVTGETPSGSDTSSGSSSGSGGGGCFINILNF